MIKKEPHTYLAYPFKIKISDLEQIVKIAHEGNFIIEFNNNYLSSSSFEEFKHFYESEQPTNDLEINLRSPNNDKYIDIRIKPSDFFDSFTAIIKTNSDDLTTHGAITKIQENLNNTSSILTKLFYKSFIIKLFYTALIMISLFFIIFCLLTFFINLITPSLISHTLFFSSILFSFGSYIFRNKIYRIMGLFSPIIPYRKKSTIIDYVFSFNEERLKSILNRIGSSLIQIILGIIIGKFLK